MRDWSRLIDASGKEFCSFRVWASEYDREVSVVNPTSLPIYFRLHSREPGIAEDGLVLAKVGEKELERNSGRSSSDV